MIARRGSAVTQALAAEDGDPDEDPTGDAGSPICGECERANHFEVLDAVDGELDDQF